MHACTHARTSAPKPLPRPHRAKHFQLPPTSPGSPLPFSFHRIPRRHLSPLPAASRGIAQGATGAGAHKHPPRPRGSHAPLAPPGCADRACALFSVPGLNSCAIREGVPVPPRVYRSLRLLRTVPGGMCRRVQLHCASAPRWRAWRLSPLILFFGLFIILRKNPFGRRYARGGVCAHKRTAYTRQLLLFFRLGRIPHSSLIHGSLFSPVACGVLLLWRSRHATGEFERTRVASSLGTAHSPVSYCPPALSNGRHLHGNFFGMNSPCQLAGSGSSHVLRELGSTRRFVRQPVHRKDVCTS